MKSNFLRVIVIHTIIAKNILLGILGVLVALGVVGVVLYGPNITGKAVYEPMKLFGAIFTTDETGSIVNENTHYKFKKEVYLDGGPPPHAPQTAAGLPDGMYVFQVTNPSGRVPILEDFLDADKPLFIPLAVFLKEDKCFACHYESLLDPIFLAFVPFSYVFALLDWRKKKAVKPVAHPHS